MKTSIIKMTPQAITTEGYMVLKESTAEVNLRFQADPAFRGTLTRVVWNMEDGVEHAINATDAEFANFAQVGERPEIDVPSTWLDSLNLPSVARLCIRFEFDTFRHEPVWYAYLYIKGVYGENNPDVDVPYKIKPVLES